MKTNLKSITSILQYSVAINYMHNTTLSLYKTWVNDNKVIPFDEIVELNYNLVINELSSITKNTK